LTLPLLHAIGTTAFIGEIRRVGEDWENAHFVRLFPRLSLINESITDPEVTVADAL